MFSQHIFYSTMLIMCLILLTVFQACNSNSSPNVSNTTSQNQYVSGSGNILTENANQPPGSAPNQDALVQSVLNYEIQTLNQSYNESANYSLTPEDIQLLKSNNLISDTEIAAIDPLIKK